MYRWFSLALVVTAVLPSFPQAKRPFTFEDMMKLKRIEEPEVSPDGKWLLFAAVDVDLAANTRTPHVWLVPAAGGEEKEIISGQDADRPRWAPDGKRFAFISTKEGGSQIWIADFDGVEGKVTAAHKLTSIATEADGELWSPDGQNILFKSDVYPECDGPSAAEQTCNEKKLDEAKNSKVKAQIFIHLLYRHWNAYTEGKRSHLFVTCVGADVSSARRGESACLYASPRDLTPGEYDAPVFSLGGQDNYAFSPDGMEICYASNHDPEPAISTNNDLWTVSVQAGDSAAQALAATRNITAENKAADNTPLYSADGKYIAYRAQQRPGYESDRWRLMLYDRKTGEKKNLTEDFDRWVGTFTWSPNSSRIYFSTESEGKAPLFSLSVASGKRVEVPTLILSSQGDMAVAPNGEDIYFTNNSVRSPIDIFGFMLCPNGCGDPPPPPPAQISHLNDAVLSQISMPPLESFWFTGAHGDKVQGWLLKPPNFDPNKKYSVKFIVHGGPEVPFGDEWSYRWNFELFAGDGYVVVFINFHGSPGYGQKFIDAINGDWGGAPFEDLMKGLDYAEEHYPFIDKTRECALGASYGGYMADWILGHTNRFKCIVTHDGMFNSESAWGTTEELWFNEWEFKGTPYTNRELYRRWSPHLSAANFKTPTLVIHSQKDYRLDVSQGLDLFTTLQRLGVPSKMLYFPDEGHWVLKPQNSQLWYKTVNDWVDQWTK